MPTPKTKAKYLKEHLTYEVLMLRYTYQRLHVTRNLQWNAMYESFVIHARNLHDFLTSRPSTYKSKRYRLPNYKASDFSTFVPKTPSNMKHTYDRMHSQVLHLGAERPYSHRRKIKLQREVKKIYDWLEREVTSFKSTLLGTAYSNSFNPDEVLSISLPPGVPTSSAYSISSGSTSSWRMNIYNPVLVPSKDKNK